MKPKSQQARRRLNLWRKDPCCFWCEVVTVLPPPEFQGRKPTDDEATLDHVLSRYVREPGEQFPAGSNTVLACRACNLRRSAEEEAAMSVEERRKAAQNGHRKIPRVSCLTVAVQGVECASS